MLRFESYFHGEMGVKWIPLLAGRTNRCWEWRQPLAELDVSGSFIITIGTGKGPETWVMVSVMHENGKPTVLNLAPEDSTQGPVSIYVALSAAFGAAVLPLYIREVQTIYTQPGFYGLRVEGPADFGQIENNGVTTLAIVVDTGKDRGQTLACACGKAEVTKWCADRMKQPTGE
jgi:hypothetical protein